MEKIELDRSEALMVVEAIDEGIFNLKNVLKACHPANPLMHKALKEGIEEWSELKKSIENQ